MGARAVRGGSFRARRPASLAQREGGQGRIIDTRRR
jgi:hypothetical protein